MAGIGFEIRNLLRKDSFLGFFRAYTYAGVIGSGPWILSFIGILLVHLVGHRLGISTRLITQFQTSVTYVIASSLIFSSIFTLAFTRYASDRIYEIKPERIVPAFLGALLVQLVGSAFLGFSLVYFFFDSQSLLYRLILVMSFVTMNGIWLTASLLSGLKQYLALVGLFGAGYAVVVVASLALGHFGLEGLLGGFLLGHFLILTGMLNLILREFPVNTRLSFDFLQKRYWYWSLTFSALAYQLGIWVDKVYFWFSPRLGQAIIGPLHSSLIYDIPIFLSYIATLPGMAVFLLRMETDFAEKHRNYYGAIHGGATLTQIGEAKEEMVDTIRQGLLEIAKIQGVAVLFAMIWGLAMLKALGISPLYQHLLFIDVVAAGLQVVFLGLCNVLFYLDKRRAVLGLSVLLLATNFLFTMASVELGAEFYGYGFAAALLVVVIAGLVKLDQDLHDLEFRTFMRRK
jgi:polysaccharide biosynthesis protein PelG